MRRELRVFTDEEKQFIKDNHGRMAQVDIARHLSVSAPLINRTLKEMGLHKARMGTIVKDSTDMCIDCARYIGDGRCSRYGTTSALSTKNCFTR
jgi:hypothetical protein